MQDFAKSWQNLTQNSKGHIASFVDFDWGAELEPWGSKPRHTDETIFATAYESAAKLKGARRVLSRHALYVVLGHMSNVLRLSWFGYPCRDRERYMYI